MLKRILNYITKPTIIFWRLALSSLSCILARSIWWPKQCSPVRYSWDRSFQPENVQTLCLGRLRLHIGLFGVPRHLLLPIPGSIHHGFNMPLRSRIAMSTALGFSMIACFVSIYKLAIFGQVFSILAVDPSCRSNA